jgi:Leucine Rich Repeat
VSLDLRSNALTTLPESIGALQHLARLDLRWNRIVPRPVWLQALQDRGCTIWD